VRKSCTSNVISVVIIRFRDLYLLFFRIRFTIPALAARYDYYIVIKIVTIYG
jgi:hypothetical protein